VNILGVGVARFAFEAVDRAGVVVRGQIDARARPVAIEQLLAAGHTPLSLKEAGGERRSVLDVLRALPRGGSDLLTITRELASLLAAGLPIERALGVLNSLASSHHTAMRVEQMRELVRSGEPLSRALRIIIPSNAEHIEHLVAAGEASGHLPAVLARLAANLDRAKVLRDRVISALTYPAFLVLTMIVVLWIIFTAVLPRLTPLFTQAKMVLPLPTMVLLEISQFIQSYGWLLIALLVLAICAAVYFLRQPPVRFALDRYFFTSRLFLRVPSEYESARFCRNLETLLEGGLSLDRALDAARLASANRWFRERVGQIQQAVEGGMRLKTAFATANALPAVVVEYSAVGEETGRLGAMMREAAELLERDVEIRLDRLTALILPIATLAMGLLVAGVMAGVVTGLLAVNDISY
jgi:general secretion pathway protein F